MFTIVKGVLWLRIQTQFCVVPVSIHSNKNNLSFDSLLMGKNTVLTKFQFLESS